MARSISDVAGMTPDRRDQRPPRRAGSGIVIARPFGIPVIISPYWFVIAGVFIVVYADDLAGTISGSTRYVVAAAFVVLLYLSVLVHELTHAYDDQHFTLDQADDAPDDDAAEAALALQEGDAIVRIVLG